MITKSLNHPIPMCVCDIHVMLLATITPLLCMTLVACFTFFRPLLHNHIVTACCLQCEGGLII